MSLQTELVICPRAPIGNTARFSGSQGSKLLTYVLRLDGLNKEMRDWDITFYGRRFNQSCRDTEMPVIGYPAG